MENETLTELADGPGALRVVLPLGEAGVTGQGREGQRAPAASMRATAEALRTARTARSPSTSTSRLSADAFTSSESPNLAFQDQRSLSQPLLTGGKADVDDENGRPVLGALLVLAVEVV